MGPITADPWLSSSVVYWPPVQRCDLVSDTVGSLFVRTYEPICSFDILPAGEEQSEFRRERPPHLHRGRWRSKHRTGRTRAAPCDLGLTKSLLPRSFSSAVPAIKATDRPPRKRRCASCRHAEPGKRVRKDLAGVRIKRAEHRHEHDEAGPPIGLTVPSPSATVRFDLNKNDSLIAGTKKAITT